MVLSRSLYLCLPLGPHSLSGKPLTKLVLGEWLQTSMYRFQLTCVIVGVLRFNFEGSPYLEFQDDSSLTWLRGASLSDVRLAAPSSILTHTNQSLTIAGGTDDKVRHIIIHHSVA